MAVTVVALSPASISDQTKKDQVTIQASGFTPGDRIFVRMPYRGTPAAHAVAQFVCNADANGNGTFAKYPNSFLVGFGLGLAPGVYECPASYVPAGQTNQFNQVPAGFAILTVE